MYMYRSRKCDMRRNMIEFDFYVDLWFYQFLINHLELNASLLCKFVTINDVVLWSCSSFEECYPLLQTGLMNCAFSNALEYGFAVLSHWRTWFSHKFLRFKQRMGFYWVCNVYLHVMENWKSKKVLQFCFSMDCLW